MNIPYYLQDLSIGPEGDHKIGRIQARGALSERNLLDRMANRGSGIGREDMRATMDLLAREIANALAEGYTVNTRIANYRPSLRGVFNSATDPFDHARHHFRATLSEGTELKKKMRAASGERITVPLPAPFPVQYTDHGSHTVDNLLTPDNIGEISGRGLKFDIANGDEGIFLVPEDGGGATKIGSVSIFTEGRLMFMVPAGLAAGEYRMEVRRAYTREGSIRAGRLHHILTVPQ